MTPKLHKKNQGETIGILRRIVCIPFHTKYIIEDNHKKVKYIIPNETLIAINKSKKIIKIMDKYQYDPIIKIKNLINNINNK